MLERIKFSKFRDSFKILKFNIKLILGKLSKTKYLWGFQFKEYKESNENKILIFAPSMSLDKPGFINVGLRNLIEEGKKKNIQFELLQCVSGLSICHLGGSPYNANNQLPCKSCVKTNSLLYKDLKISKLQNINISKNFDKFSNEELKNYEYKGINVGKKSLTTISWIIRSSEILDHHREYLINSIKSCIKIIDFLENFDIKSFSGVLVFNGLTLPESIMYEWCSKNNINVATFESGWSIENEVALELNYSPSPQHLFTFDDRKLSERENKKLKEYIEKKRISSTNFISPTDKKIISIFGNVSWDTSQTVSSNVYESMYEWLDSLIPIINKNKDLLFVFRAHPGEYREIKKTWYGLEDWFRNNKSKIGKNAICYSAKDTVDSYQIIENSELVLVYNSTIGIESIIFGTKAIAAANTHYTKIGFIESFESVTMYLENLEKTLFNKNFDLDVEKMNQASSYYFQLLSEVAYNFGEINQNLRFNEHTLVKNYQTDSFNIDKLDNTLISFLNRGPLEKKFNL